jgi:tetratricopeptide (TPR) repeat protein
MAELSEQDGGAEPESTVEPISAAAAMAIGVRKGRSREHSDPEFDAFLRDQRRLINLQTEHLHEQREVILARLKLGRWKDSVTLALQGMTAVVGLALAGAIGVMAWQAHQDHGLIVAPFSVPPDLAQRGLTGQVVAARVLDRLSDLQTQTVSTRPASTYANDWGDDIKVEIPETGVSIGELNRWLREWLGGEARVTGEVVRAPEGLQVTARVGSSAGQTVKGPEADVDALVSQAAEALYAQTQPYRYAVYLQSRGQTDKAQAAYERLAASGSKDDRAWALAGWSSLLGAQGRNLEAIDKASAAIRLNPRLHPAYAVLTYNERRLNWSERELAHLRAVSELERSGKIVGIAPAEANYRARLDQAMIEARLGDGRQLMAIEASDNTGAAAAPSFQTEGVAVQVQLTQIQASVSAARHDLTDARRRIMQAEAAGADKGSFITSSREILVEEVADDWSGLVAFLPAFIKTRPPDIAAYTLRPIEAYALARVGRQAEAEALIAQSPPDCPECSRRRGQIAALAGHWAEVDRWFADAERQEPSIPLAPTQWGAALLAKGDADGAIARLQDAHRKGPHYADPLELWGEALMTKHDYAGAIARFAEADQYTPRWGRNHILWGEALMLSGRYAEARAQFEAANGMDLGKADRAALNVLLARTGSGPLHG